MFWAYTYRNVILIYVFTNHSTVTTTGKKLQWAKKMTLCGKIMITTVYGKFCVIDGYGNTNVLQLVRNFST
jgi:hypothetical protein